MDPRQEATLSYLKLALLCDRRRHFASRDRLLLGAAEAALKAGWPEVAEGCRDVVLRSNPRHMLRRWPTFREAAQSDAFRPLLQQTRRFCSLERAEFLLQAHRDEATEALPATPQAADPCAVALAILAALS